MKVVIKLPILLFILSHSAWGQSNTLSLSVNKSFYSKGETVYFSVAQFAPMCGGIPATAYLDLLDSKLQLQQQEILKLNSLQTQQQFILPETDSGYFLLRAYTKEQAENQPKTIQYIAIGVGIPAENQGYSNRPTILLFPEGGKALANFTNRYAVYLHNLTGQPVQEKLLIRNKAGQLIAVCNTDVGGWGRTDIPLLQNDIVTIQTAGGVVLKTINVPSEEVSNNGFSLQVNTEAGQVNVEIRKAESENRRKAFLEVMHKNVLLFDANAFFRGDTNIVATSFSAKGFENKLLHILVKDENGNIVSERQLLQPSVSTDEEWKQVLSEMYCQLAFPVPGNISPQTINDYLISVKPSLQPPVQAEGFSMFFLNKEVAGQTLSYSVTGSDNAVLQIGNTTVDGNGLWEINGCSFKGEAYIQFYLNNKRLNSYTKRVFPTILSDSISALQKLTSLLPVHSALSGNAGLNSYTSSLVTNPQKEKELEAVTVVGKKSRIVELEDKYISNGFFRDINSVSVNVEDDESSVNNRIESYLVRKIPGILLQKKGLCWYLVYRQGYVDYYIDETPVSCCDINNLSIREIGFIRFFRNPVRGGMAAQSGGQLLRGGSGYAAGLQGSLAIYTRKYIGEKESVNPGKGIPVVGYIND